MQTVEGQPLFANLTTSHRLTGIDQLWRADLTSIHLQGGTLVYLACVLDA